MGQLKRIQKTINENEYIFIFWIIFSAKILGVHIDHNWIVGWQSRRSMIGYYNIINRSKTNLSS